MRRQLSTLTLALFENQKIYSKPGFVGGKEPMFECIKVLKNSDSELYTWLKDLGYSKCTIPGVMTGKTSVF